MERFKERITQMRAEIEAANTQAREASERAKHLETEKIRKHQEQRSLALRVDRLQERLEEKQHLHQQVTERFEEANQRAEQLEKKLQALQQAIEDREAEHEATGARYKDAKAEMDELVRQLDGV